MRQLTIRNVSDVVARKLDRLSERTGKSINTLMLELLDQSFGTKGRRERLRRYVTWSQSDLEEFEESLRAQRQVDEAQWR